MGRLCVIRLWLLLWAAGFSLAGTAQVKTVRAVRGEYPLLADITRIEAERLALEEAKKQALLRVAGEKITVTDVLRTQGGEQDFSSFSASEVLGGVVGYEIAGTSLEKNVLGDMVVVVEINAQVLRYRTEKDPSFTFVVQGIKPVYGQGEPFAFTLSPNCDGYLRVFVLEGFEKANQILPNEYDKNILLKAGEIHAFPQKSSFVLTKDTEGTSQTDRLVFVFTRGDIPFHGKEDFDGVQGWINGIEPSLREVYYREITIRD